jgi:hypothetical protein
MQFQVMKLSRCLLLLDNKEFVINFKFDEDKKIALGFRNAAGLAIKYP